MAKGSYYNHVLRNKNGNTEAARKQSEMTPIIEQIFHENHEVFRSSKIYAILKDRGYAISKSTVAKIMHQNGLFSIRACAKTLYKQQLERKNNILQQQFHVSRPDEVWVSDVTYFSVFNRMYHDLICLRNNVFSLSVSPYTQADFSVPKKRRLTRIPFGYIIIDNSIFNIVYILSVIL